MAPYYKQYLLGSGSYGKVWVVRASDSNIELKVLKEIKLHGLQERDIEQAVTEVTILSLCQHKHIITYIEAFLCEGRTLSIVMEYASGGDVHHQITQRRGLYFPNETVRKWFLQLLLAIQYIHGKGILHRDIKPQNLFLTDKQDVKLGDFGISRILHHDADVAMTLIGTPFYLSPEICKQQPYSFKSDMWSAGCVLYELCSLRVPFTGPDLPSLAAQIQGGSYSLLPSHCDEMFHDLVNSLLRSEPEKRPSATDILQNSIMQNLAKKIDSTTYTVLKLPKIRRLSLASPELSAMIAKQRSQSLEAPRVMSDNIPRKTKGRKQQVSPPCLNLMTAVQSKASNKTRNCENRGRCPAAIRQETMDWLMEQLTEVIYGSLFHDLSSEQADQKVLSLLHSALGQEKTEAMIAAVKSKVSLEDLLNGFDIQLPVIHSIMWYLKLSVSS